MIFAKAKVNENCYSHNTNLCYTIVYKRRATKCKRPLQLFKVELMSMKNVAKQQVKYPINWAGLHTLMSAGWGRCDAQNNIKTVKACHDTHYQNEKPTDFKGQISMV